MPTKKSNKKILGPPNNLKNIRVKEGLRYSELSNLSGVSGRTIKDIENRVIRGTPETKHKIFNGLNKYKDKTKTYTFEMIFPN